MGRILVVDDDPIAQDLLTSALERAGYEALVAADGWQACQLVEQEQFDAIITDEIMSAMNGLEFCRHVRELGQQTPIVLCTSLDEDLIRPELREEFGIIAILGKPLVPPLLLYILEAHLKPAGVDG